MCERERQTDSQIETEGERDRERQTKIQKNSDTDSNRLRPRRRPHWAAGPQTHLGQGVPPEAGGPSEGAGYSHGHQCQQPLCLVQNRIGVWEAGSVLQAWRPARPQLPSQLLPHALCPQEEEGRRSEAGRGWGPPPVPSEVPSS